ncbi:MAG: 4Fe-4S binding protein [Thermodesulfobacteriaceae bacterium]|nr:4Fe-4S binding protein [Thermodesulfobacteriaceae bacterium]MDW8135627.1 4Fe-4S binding protein [Thermodesulfobacterium sp.]
MAKVKRKIVEIDEKLCDGCGKCVLSCQEGAIVIVDGKAKLISEALCDGLGACIGECPTGALKIIEREAEEFISLHPKSESSLNWPVKIKLVPVEAPFLKEAKLLICADCCPVVFSEIHSKLFPNRKILIGCPKIESKEFYQKKLAEIFKENSISSVEVVIMEVPCCKGLMFAVKDALKETGKKIPFKCYTIGIKGKIIREETF